MTKIIVVGNRATILEALVELKFVNLQVLAIQDSNLAIYCDQKNITHSKIITNNDLYSQIINAEFDLLLCSGWPYKIDIQKFHKQKLINFHPSLLPFYPGKHAITESLEKFGPFGVTAHFMDENLDTGEIIEQIRFEPTTVPSADFMFHSLFKLEKFLATNVITRYLNSGEIISLNVTPFSRDINYYQSDWRESVKFINGRVGSIPSSHGKFNFSAKNKDIRISKSWIVTCDIFDKIFSELESGFVVEYSSGYLFSGVDGWLYFE
jgi:folate-dependent phosphoribosylglycinamide formyltransferase PurN